MTKSHNVAITGIIIKNGKYLIAKRSADEVAFPNKWCVPGGKLEMKDYIDRPKDTNFAWHNVFELVLTREIEEEVGLQIKNIGYLTNLTFIRPDGIPTLVVSMYADHHVGEVKLCDELTCHAWVSLKEAEKYDLIEGIYEQIAMLDKLNAERKI